MNSAAMIQQGTAATEAFGSRSLTRSAETATSAMQASATAAVQARFVMARQQPRSWDDVRVRVLGECKRPGFAQVARYHKPIGDGIEGPSIRFAEACARYAGNLGVDTVTTFEDSRTRHLKIVATDFEGNLSYAAEVAIHKVVERKNARGRTVIAERQNSYGQTVYLVEATDDEILNTQNALVSKAARTLILRLIPGDIVDEGQAACIETLRTAAAKDPSGERKRLCDAFAAIGVLPRDLETFVGHTLESLQPSELVELRQVYATIRDGETTWKAVVESRGGENGDAPGKKTSIADKVRAKGGSKKSTAKASPSAPTQPAPAPSHDPATGEVADEDVDPYANGPDEGP